ncbi:DUF3105 domain-containing protein [Euzebya sp.]|uniref:DUF3105 domain-containing protein n=1 Tax=Euzebya sp. TaxID=1971409 RepID=UPI00351570C6
MDEPDGVMLSKRQRQKARRQDRIARERDVRRRENRVRLLRWALLIVFGGGALAVLLFSAVRDVLPVDPPQGITDITVDSRGHVEGDVVYDTVPPAGGDHSPVWQNCGFYPEPIGEENAVHSLEHGAVWITYRSDLDEAAVQALAERAGGYVLVSPRDDLPSPIVASAWGKQLQLDDADDPVLEDFIRAFQQGPQTPEPGAVCTRGVGEPT